jgi:hypothetical protein
MYRLLYSGQPLDDGLGTRITGAVLRASLPTDPSRRHRG